MYKRPAYVITSCYRILNHDKRTLIFEDRALAEKVFRKCLHKELEHLIAMSSVRKFRLDGCEPQEKLMNKSPLLGADIFHDRFVSEEIEEDFDLYMYDSPEFLELYLMDGTPITDVDFSWKYIFDEDNESVSLETVVSMTLKGQGTVVYPADRLTFQRIFFEADPLDPDGMDGKALEEERANGIENPQTKQYGGVI